MRVQETFSTSIPSLIARCSAIDQGQIMCLVIEGIRFKTTHGEVELDLET